MEIPLHEHSTLEIEIGVELSDKASDDLSDEQSDKSDAKSSKLFLEARPLDTVRDSSSLDGLYWLITRFAMPSAVVPP
jgi:hypothetical protein